MEAISKDNHVKSVAKKLSRWLDKTNLLVTQSCPTLCNPMDYITPGFPVLHHTPELAQTHVN